MEGSIKNFTVIKVLCHLILTMIWFYWGISVHPLTLDWIGLTGLIGGGLIYFIVGAICMVKDYETDAYYDGPWWAMCYSIINLILLGSMMHNVGFYPNDIFSLIWPASFAIITLVLYGFNRLESAVLLAFISVSLWMSNWGIHRWYDYCLLLVALILALISTLIASFKDVEDEDEKSGLLFLLNFVLSSVVNWGILSLLYYNDLLSTENPYNVLYLILEAILFSLVVCTRLITVILIFVGGGLYWLWSTEYTFSTLITNLSFEWIYSTWFKVFVWIVGGVLVLGLIGYIIYKLMPSKIVYRNKELPMMYNGLSMTCPVCRKTMVTGKYAESATRGVLKATTKGVVKIGGVGTFATVGGIFGPIGIAVGALIGGAATYYKNQKINELVDNVIDLWNYEVDGGRTVYFKCPLCGNKWEETEMYGEIEH